MPIATRSLSSVSSNGIELNLVGDVNNTRNHDHVEGRTVEALSRQVADATSFVFDVNMTGVISVSDISHVKSRSGSMLVR